MHIDYPYHIDARGRTATTGDADHVRDLIEQLLFTSPAERVNRPDFGSGIQQMLFAPNRVEIAAAVQFTMQAALQRWLDGLIELQDLSVDAVDSSITVTVQYVLVRTGEPRVDTFSRGVS